MRPEGEAPGDPGGSGADGAITVLMQVGKGINLELGRWGHI